MKNDVAKKRILAIDILRGITIAGMILVNNPGSWGHIFTPLDHAEWIGLTPTDFVFPFFMFIMGITTYISLRKYDFRPSVDAIKKIVVRTIVIMLVGSFIGLFVHFCRYWGNVDETLSFGKQLLEALNLFPTLRFTGVLHRLAICYCIVSILALLINHKRFPLIIAVLFIGYFIILECGNGFAYDETNILSSAQKNLSMAGVTVIIVKDEMLGKAPREIPTMLDYRTHVEKGSMFNTPPVVPIYTLMENLRWLKANGGVEAADKRAHERAEVLYAEIDRNKLFKGTVEEASRSLMNICFVMNDEYKELEKPFLDFATERGMVGVKGHRSVGGFRASCYNAQTMEGVQALVKAMQDFEAQH